MRVVVTLPSSERPSGGRRIGFPKRTIDRANRFFAPVEYLTYESRKAVTQQALPYRIHPKQPQSISMTSPVCQIRICIAFCKSEIISAQTELRGKSKEGGRCPLLGRFKGVCQGVRAPTRIQRSDSCGKRRNNGTDDACPPQAADRMRDVEFVPTQLPLCRFLFTASGLFLCHQRKRGLNAAPPAQNFTAVGCFIPALWSSHRPL